MDYKLINEALSNIYTLRYNGMKGKFTKVLEERVDNLRGGESQGEYDEIIEIYSLGKDDLHLKLTFRTDSYGENESIISIQVVKPIIKQVTDFQAI